MLCILVLTRGMPIPQAAQAGPEGLGCIRCCVGVCGTCVFSFSHGASLSPKRPRQDRRDSVVSAAMWEWRALVYPRSPVGRPYPPSGPGKRGGTRVHPPLCGSGWTLCMFVLQRGVPIPQAAQAGLDGLGCIYQCVGTASLCVSSFSHGASLSSKRHRQDRGVWGASAAVWEWLALVYPRSPVGHPHPPSGPGKSGGMGVYSRLCTNGLSWCILVLPRGVPIPHAAQTGPGGSGCISPCFGVASHCAYSFSHGASLSPKRPRQGWRDSAVSAFVWEWVDVVYPRSPTGRAYPRHGPGLTGGTGVHPPMRGSG